MYDSTGRSDDLCYYMHDGPDAFRFELTGRLSQDAARDLEQAWCTAASTIGKRRVIIDLSGLTGIDRNGHELLDRWAGAGAQLAVVNPRAAARLQPMIDRPVTVLTAATVPTTRLLTRTALWCAASLTFLSPTNAATLKQETVNGWEDYIQNASRPKTYTFFYRKAGSGNPEKFPRFGKTVPSLVESTPNQVASVAPY
jgi:hypothetical protein